MHAVVAGGLALPRCRFPTRRRAPSSAASSLGCGPASGTHSARHAGLRPRQPWPKGRPTHGWRGFAPARQGMPVVVRVTLIQLMVRARARSWLSVTERRSVRSNDLDALVRRTRSRTLTWYFCVGAAGIEPATPLRGIASGTTAPAPSTERRLFARLLSSSATGGELEAPHGNRQRTGACPARVTPGACVAGSYSPAAIPACARTCWAAADRLFDTHKATSRILSRLAALAAAGRRASTSARAAGS